MKNVAHRTMRWTLLLVFTSLVFIAILTGAARISLPFVGNYRAEIQDYVSNYLGNSVEIGSLDLSWHGVGPRLVLGDIVLLSGAGRDQDLQFEEILLDLNLLRSWVNGSWQIHEMSLVGANLSVEHLGNSQFRVYGHQLDTRKQNKNANLNVLGWLTNADSVALLESRVHLIDDARNINLDMQNLNIRAQNLSGLHQIRLDTTVPGITPDIIRFSADFYGASDNLKLTNGKFYFTSDNVDLEKVAALSAIESPLTLSGTGSLDLWGEWGGGATQTLRLKSSAEELLLENKKLQRSWTTNLMELDVVIKKENENLKLGIQKFSFGKEKAEETLLAGNLSFNQNDFRNYEAHLYGSRIELDSVASVLPVFEGIENIAPGLEIVRTVKPEGNLHDWYVSAEAADDSMINLSAQADLDSVTFQPYKKLPGFSGIDGRLAIRDNLGELSLIQDSIGFSMPRWFRNGITIDKLDGSLAFRFDRDNFELQSTRLNLENKHVRGNAQFHYRKNRGESGWLDVDAQLDEGDARFAKLYYPVGKMNSGLVSWMDAAIKQGNIKNGYLNIHGPIKGFPYANTDGEFQAGFDITKGHLNFLPDWPAATSVVATAKFERNSMTINGSHAVIAGNTVSSMKTRIADFKTPVLRIQGEASGDSPDLLKLVETSPLNSILNPVIKDSTISGPVSLSLELDAPLAGFSQDKLKINGGLEFSGNSWKSEPFGFDLTEIRGGLDFTQDSLTSDGLLARFLDRPIAMTAKTDKQNSDVFSKISIAGTLPAKGILENYSIPVDHWFDGESVWRLDLIASQLAGAEAGMSIDVSARSNLEGTSVNLPTPYDKAPDEKLAVAVNTRFLPTDENAIWNINYADKITGKARISANSSELDALLIGFGEVPPSDDEIVPGIVVNGAMPALSFDGWISTISEVIDRLPESETKNPIIPVKALLKTNNLLVGQVNAGPARIRGGSSEDYLIAGIASRWFSGDIQFPREHWDREKPLKASLSLLDKQFLDAMSTGESSGGRLDPESLPPMEVTVEKFIWDDIHVADMSMRSVPVTNGVNVESLGFIHEHLKMTGSAEWRVSDDNAGAEKAHNTSVNFQLNSDDAGKGMGNIGIDGAFAEGAGQIDVNLSWDDAMYAPAFDELRGSIEMKLHDGRVLAVEPGAAKILGLFAFQAVPRRLLLDFEDLTKEGLRYDKVDASIKIDNGIAETRFMQMQGPIGVVFSSGSTDFIGNTYDQKVTVLPRLTATLPIIGLLSAGATAGVGVLVIDQVLKGLGINFDEIGKREYRLTGSWDDPLIERIIAPAPDKRYGDDR